jgi:hypothetical protein
VKAIAAVVAALITVMCGSFAIAKPLIESNIERAVTFLNSAQPKAEVCGFVWASKYSVITNCAFEYEVASIWLHADWMALSEKSEVIFTSRNVSLQTGVTHVQHCVPLRDKTSHTRKERWRITGVRQKGFDPKTLNPALSLKSGLYSGRSDVGSDLCLANAPRFIDSSPSSVSAPFSLVPSPAKPNQGIEAYGCGREAKQRHEPLSKRVLSVNPPIKFANPKVGVIWLAILAGLGCGIPVLIIALSERRTAELGDSPYEKEQRQCGSRD